MKWTYAIIPISFEDYNEYVDRLNELGEVGWIVGAMIRTYENSPTLGTTTHDFICRQPGSALMEKNYLMTMEDLRDYLPENPARQTVYAWVNDRKIPYEKHGRRLYFKRSVIDTWLAKGRRY